MKATLTGFAKTGLAALLILPMMASAKTFSNNYISFELPNSWNCEQQGNEWLCSPLDANRAKDALIILSAKETGPDDSLQAYKAYLAKPRIIKNNKNVPEPSSIIHIKTREINSQPWVEGLHLGSEIEGFYTLYLATVKQGLAVLVSISSEKTKASQFNEDFAMMVRSVRLTASNELLSAIAKRKELNNQSPIGIPSNLDATATGAAESTAFGLSKEMIWGIFGALFLLVIYFGISTFYPKKRKRR